MSVEQEDVFAPAGEGYDELRVALKTLAEFGDAATATAYACSAAFLVFARDLLRASAGEYAMLRIAVKGAGVNLPLWERAVKEGVEPAAKPSRQVKRAGARSAARAAGVPDETAARAAAPDPLHNLVERCRAKPELVLAPDVVRAIARLDASIARPRLLNRLAAVVGKCAEALQRAVQRQIEADQADAAAREEAGGREGQPTTALERPRDDAGTLVAVAATHLVRELIIVFGKQYYLLRASGEYSRPFSYTELSLCWYRELRWIEAAGVGRVDTEREEEDARGQRRKRKERKSLSQVLDECSTVVQGEACASMVAQRSYYNPQAESFTEAVCRRRDIEPAYDARVDRWLRLLGGARAESLLDWIATLIDLSRPTSILLLIGPAGAGKTMLAHGLARVFTTGAPTELLHILGGFNSGVAECPLVFADEGLPKVPGKSVTSELRRVFSGSGLALSRKFRDPMPLRGAPRCIVAANGQAVFDFGEELTEDDAEAIGARFLHIRIARERAAGDEGDPKETSPATRYLAEIGGRDATADWVEGDRIAAHALWLAAHRTVTRGRRFLVEGQADELVSRVAVSNGTASDVCEWLVRAILDNWKGFDPELCEFVVRRGGHLLVAAEVFIDERRWRRYVHRRNTVPTAQAAGRALTTITYPEPARRGLSASPTRRFRRVRVDRLAAWAEASGLSTEAVLAAWFEEMSCPEPKASKKGPPPATSKPAGDRIEKAHPESDNTNNSDSLDSNLPDYRFSSHTTKESIKESVRAAWGSSRASESGNPVGCGPSSRDASGSPAANSPRASGSNPVESGNREAADPERAAIVAADGLDPAAFAAAAREGRSMDLGDDDVWRAAQ